MSRPWNRLALPALLAALALPAAFPAHAQDLTRPPSGDNQRASVTQWIGLVSVRLDYNSPDVHGPDGADRRGQIWGKLVPYGLHDQGFNNCTQCPWRAGANEATVFTVSHDVRIEGQPLKAGSYGLFMIADPNEWTVIFSRDHTSWGAYTYDPAEDALRVKVKPSSGCYQEWLTYEFTDRQPAKATVALRWEELQVPFTISVDDMPALYMAQMARELRNRQGFEWRNWMAGAQYSLETRTDLPTGLAWARNAVSKPGIGEENFQTLSTLARLEGANGLAADSAGHMQRALDLPSATPVEIHMYARQLQAGGDNAGAMRVFELNAKRFPGRWPVELGLARGYAGLGDYRKAVTHAERAVGQAPDADNRANAERLLAQYREKAAAPAGR